MKLLTMLAGTAAALALLTSGASATHKQPPRDPNCQKWEKHAMFGNWVNAPNRSYWYCVAGEGRGTAVELSTVLEHEYADGGDGSKPKKPRPGHGYGDTNHDHSGPPGQNKKIK